MPRVKLFDRNEVLHKATELFWKQGYNATSIQDLVNHLGINRASLYDTFGGKEALFKEAIQLYKTTNHNATKAFLLEQSSVKEGILKLFELALKNGKADKDRKGCFIVNTATELVPCNPSIEKIVSSNNAQLEKIFHDFLQSGVTSGEISKDKDLKSIASLLFTLLNGVQVLSKLNTDSTSQLTSIKTLLSILD